MEEETKTIKIPYGYEFDRVEDGKVILKKKEVKLLKNYTDCLHSIKFEGFPEWFPNISVPQGMLKPIYSLCQLLICRNAWWKELGWKPDWEDSGFKYIITTTRGAIDLSDTNVFNIILAFPTKEVRDQFYEAFKDLIEEAKELL